MSFDDKMRTIKILLDAIDMAFEEAWEFNKLYDFFTAHGYRERKKYFRSAREGESEYYIPRHGAIQIIETSALDISRKINWLSILPNITPHAIRLKSKSIIYY
jgi:hypothetical protein